MGTRGKVAFRYKGVYYIIGCEYDSYFSWLGERLVKELKCIDDIGLWRRLLELADSVVKPPPEDTAARNEWDDILTKLPEGKEEGLLSDCFRGTLNHFFYEGKDTELERGNLWIEYTYIICLDDEVFHATDFHNHRYITRWPIREIPDDWMSVANNGTGLTSTLWIHKSYFADWEQKLLAAGYKPLVWLEHSAEATVWSVVETKTGEPQVIKILYKRDDSLVDKFDREAVIARRLLESPQPHLVRIHQVMELNGHTAIVMEKYDGDMQGLWTLITDNFSTDPRGTYLVHFLTMMENITAGTCELHKLGFVHYDIKFENMLYKKDPSHGSGGFQFVLCDFEGACRPSTGDEESRWENGWTPYKFTESNLPDDFQNISPWRVDFGTLAKLMRSIGSGLFVGVDGLQQIIDVLEDHSKDDQATLLEVQSLVCSAKDGITEAASDMKRPSSATTDNDDCNDGKRSRM
jgi:tRNA A-37 threonylcarbamoyl transferase component Bud32